MKKSLLPFIAAAFLSAASTRAQVEYVDPSMGGQGFMLEPTRPTVSLPNSMVRVYPVRHDQLDDQIHSFPLTIISHRLGELFWLMPSDGLPGAWDRAQAYDQEVETPYYYSARFDNSLIQTEFTPTARCGYFRFTFSSGQPVVLLANRIVFQTFGADDFTNMPSLAGKLKQPADALTIYLKGKLSDKTMTALTNHPDAAARPNPLQAALAQDLNNIVTNSIYDAERFSNVVLRTETKALLDQNPQGEALQHLNRLLLEDAYPMEISKKHKPGAELFDSGNNSISGTEPIISESTVTPGVMHAYVYGEFSASVKIETRNNDSGKRLAITAQDNQKVLEFRYGISFISVEQAKKNLQEEIPAWNFDKVKRSAKDRWNAVLGQVQVEGGTSEQKRVFYTSLYRCYERMVNITEDGQYYSAFDRQVHQDARPFYVDNWLWDTYRALEPLQTILNPEMEADKLQSYVRMYEQSGWMPEFAVLWGNHECMTGNPFAPWATDAWNKGITNFDVASAYAGIKKNSVEGTWLPWHRGPKGPLDDFLNEHGYMPALNPDEKETVDQLRHGGERRQAISVTEAQSYDDWCTAQLARESGNDSDYQFFLKRAADYKNVFRQDKGHAWPKDAAGKWIEPFESGWSGGQGGRDYTTENNGYTYDWDVQHDLQGLFELMGGRDKAEAKLDQLFREGLGRSKFEFWAKFPDASGLVGQFSMGNEPSFHIPYIYNYLGAPWKTQKRVRMLLDTWFTDTTLGMPGDEDGGGMSSFVVFSMMGFYPVTPGVPIYDLASPVFDRITIHLHNGKTVKIICRNNSKDNKYIQSIKLNGQPLNQVWFHHADIVNGGIIELQMGNTPNLQLGADPSTFPPSAMSVNPKTF
jgi:predicted alpha-1,2-mannosidase